MAKRSLKDKAALTISKVAEQYNAKYGKGTIVRGGHVTRDCPRIPTGVFAFDFITGGGIPIWRATCIWGPPWGGKTTLAVLLMKMVSKLCFQCFEFAINCTCKNKSPLRRKSVFVDIEGTLDREWVEALGVEENDYYYSSPDYGEQAVDVAEDMVRADDCGLVIVDSLAALEPLAELDAAAAQDFMGLQPRLVAKMFRKVVARLIQERKAGHPVAALFINQIRMKMGVGKFENPEDQPSGFAAKFAYSLAVRVGARALKKDKEPAKFADDGSPLIAKTSLKVNKHKVKSLAQSGEYEIAKITTEDFRKGQVLDARTTVKYAREYGAIESQGKKFSMLGQQYPTMRALATALAGNGDLLLQLKMETVKKAKEKS